MSKKAAFTFIVLAIALIAALSAGIIYILKHSAPEPVQVSGDLMPSQTDESVPAVSMDALTMDEIIEQTSVKPSEWYGMYESNGPMERTIDFATYKDKCPDIYAWIEIPGTAIDYPIAYCEDAQDPFWFTHDIDGNESDKGMIITDSLNAKDFSDPETLIYGNNPKDGTMFSELSRFHNRDFFDAHERINIYMEDAELTYRVYACYVGSADHIFASYDFGDPADHTKYFDSISEIRDLAMNIREDARPSYNDHAIALITHCDDENKRLFVHAVLEEIRF